MTPHDAYANLVQRNREIALLGSCGAVLGWDRQTYMPHGGIELRGNQLALIAGLSHTWSVDPQVGEWLSLVEHSDLVADPLSPAAVNVREWRVGYDRETKLPQSLVEELARVTTLAEQQWTEARQKEDFAQFAPWLEKIVGLKRQQSECWGYAEVPYDAHLNVFEPGMTTRQAAVLFAELRAPIVELVAKIAAATRLPKADLLRREFPIDAQEQFGKQVASAYGFDFERGRLDTTAHPFCSGTGPGDCRLTTRYNVHYFNDAFFSILHEAGHGIYEQGLDPQYFGSPMGCAVSLGVHESQSRLWENNVGRSRAFWEYQFPVAQKYFPALAGVSADDFHFAINSVQPSFVRVDADEVTYNLHILIRFEIEQELLTGNLPIADVPAAWNERYQTYLGITPPNDRLGCLQDIHWSAGLLGYFPTYSIGNVYAAELFDQAEKELGDLSDLFLRGEYQPLKEWLGQKVHLQGQRYRSADLIRTITGSDPSPFPLIRQMRAKYKSLYGID